MGGEGLRFSGTVVGEGVLSGWGGSLVGEGKPPVLLLSSDHHMMFVAPGSQIPLLRWLY